MFRVLLLMLLTLALSTGQAPKEGVYCRMRSGKIGRCRKFENCQQDQKDFSNNRKWPAFCTPSWNLICCNDLNKEHNTWIRSKPRFPEIATVSTSTIATVKMGGYGEKSRQKCKEYSRWRTPPILILGAKKIPGVCGISIEPTIVGGVKASALEFPHMARLRYSDPSILCGASLISEKFLLTAAHCLRGAQGPLAAILGTGDTRSNVIARIAKKIPHPKYRPSQKYHDIALLQLEKPLSKFTDYMRPACLQTEHFIPEEEATATGWGREEYEGDTSDILLKVNLPFVKHFNCSKTYRKSLELKKGIDESSMICAGGYEINKDTCQGDSGGPLQIGKKEPICMYNIVGITSFGDHCGLVPGVYTRVSKYVPWIESILWP